MRNSGRDEEEVPRLGHDRLRELRAEPRLHAARQLVDRSLVAVVVVRRRDGARRDDDVAERDPGRTADRARHADPVRQSLRSLERDTATDDDHAIAHAVQLTPTPVRSRPCRR